MEYAGNPKLGKKLSIIFVVFFLFVRTGPIPYVIYHIQISDVNFLFKIIVGGGLFVSLIWVFQALNLIAKELMGIDEKKFSPFYHFMKNLRKRSFALNCVFLYLSFRWMIFNEFGFGNFEYEVLKKVVKDQLGLF